MRRMLTALLDGARHAGFIDAQLWTHESNARAIALYERAVGLYASLVGINAYHQPGVEAGKKAAAGVLDLQRRVLAALAERGSGGATVEQYGRSLPDFASLPPSAADAERDALFARSWDHAGQLQPK